MTQYLSKNTKHCLFIISFVFFQYGLIVIMDGVYWDDWAILSLLEDKNWELLKEYFSEVGLPLIGYFHKIFGSSSNIVLSYKIFILASLSIFGCLVYQICNKTKFFSSLESFFIALLTLSYPANKCDFLFITSPYLCCINFFLLGHYLLIITQNQAATNKFIKKSFAVFLLLLSFNTNSLLLFYWPFFLLVFIVFSNYKYGILNFIKKNYFFIALPFIYWTAKEIFSPRHGRYQAYNRIIIKPDSLLKNSYKFIEFGIVDPLRHFIPISTKVFLGTLFILSLLLFILNILRRTKANLNKGSSFNTLMGQVFVVGSTLVFSVLPYILVGKSPQFENGWSTRHSLLLNIPMAMICFFSIKWLSKSNSGGVSKVSFTLLLVLVIWFSSQKVTNIVLWQARWVKDSSIISKLSGLPSGSIYSVYWIDDKFPVTKETYRFYEWAAMFEKSWGGETRVGFTFGDTSSFLAKQPHFGKIHNLSNFNSKGAHAKMTISIGGINQSNTQMVLSYWKYKFFDEKNLPVFLKNVTEIRIDSIESPLKGSF